MTAEELRSHFNRVFGIENEWPKIYEVDAETYARCCQSAFNWYIENKQIKRLGGDGRLWYNIELSIGLNGGLMFKNVELILKP